jgi:hypothetical protein
VGCVPSASDLFLSKNDNSVGKTREASEGVEYDIYFTEYDFCPVWSRVLIFTHCPIKLIYLWLLIWGIIIYIYCMLGREIWKFIHPRVSYSLRATPEGNTILVGAYIFIFPELACYKCFNMKQARPWMLTNLKIIWQFHAHPVHQKVSRFFWPRYIGDDFFLGPNLVSFNRTVVPYEISKVNFRVETKILVSMSEEI